MSPPRILHLFPDTKNLGDHFVQIGIQRLLRENLPQHTYSTLPCQANRDGDPAGIDETTVDQINDSDLLVIGGSNILETSEGRWGVHVDLAIVPLVKPPVLVLGVGSGWSFAFPKIPALSGNAAEEITAVMESSIGISVRDHLTKRVLDSAEIGGSVVTGCPALQLVPGSRPTSPPLVGVSFLPKRMYQPRSLNPRTRRSPTYQRRRLITKGFLRLLDALDRDDINHRVLVHDEEDLPHAHQLLGSGYFYSPDPNALLDEIKDCAVVVGFRLHACIAAISFGIPGIPILADGRALSFVETLGLIEASVPVDPAMGGSILDRVRLALTGDHRLWSAGMLRREQLGLRFRDFLTELDWP